MTVHAGNSSKTIHYMYSKFIPIMNYCFGYDLKFFLVTVHFLMLQLFIWNSSLTLYVFCFIFSGNT